LTKRIKKKKTIFLQRIARIIKVAGDIIEGAILEKPKKKSSLIKKKSFISF
jgi:hypothetical protein